MSKPTVSHPKYIEMVVNAIKALGDKSGLSRQAINKYIVKEYKLTENNHHNAMLKQALQRGSGANGPLVHKKGKGAAGSFKIKPAPVKPAKPATKKAPAKKNPAKKAPAKKKVPARKPAQSVELATPPATPASALEKPTKTAKPKKYRLMAIMPRDITDPMKDKIVKKPSTTQAVSPNTQSCVMMVASVNGMLKIDTMMSAAARLRINKLYLKKVLAELFNYYFVNILEDANGITEMEYGRGFIEHPNLSKTFDCVPRDLLLAKLKAYGVAEHGVALLRSYLSGRSQRVKVGACINAYPDDEQIYASEKDPVKLEMKLQWQLLEADQWFGINGIITNPDKYQAMILGFTMNDTNIPVKDNIDLLAENIDKNLQFNSHV
ncbi:Histone H1-delta [Stylophora pistillata]|uniref:Histone H1-delta n=1 Tax=Stylophora pistillata TaxID=50429 RepID=A0A2B4SSY5_STYPI|nr:Histone H1-delta [Stylophora pistillata]